MSYYQAEALIMPRTIPELLNNTTDLISFPEIALRVNSLVEDGNSSAEDIADLVQQDTALTAKLLKFSNSAYLGFRAEIDTVPRAVAVLGTQRVRDLTLGIAVVNSFAGVSNEILSMENHWRHSVLCGLSAGALAAHTDQVAGGPAFTAGLLHDLGQLILYSQEPELSKQVVELLEEESGVTQSDQAEMIVFGFDHCELGAALAQSWDLPERLVACLRYHHQPHQSKEYSADACLIHLATSIAVLAELNIDDIDQAPPMDSFAWETLNINSEVIPEITHTVNENAVELLSVLL